MMAPVGSVLNLEQYLGRGKPTSRIRKVEMKGHVLVDTNTVTAWIGIDIAKLTFDACLLQTQGKPQKKSFPNTTEGFTKMMRWVQHLAPQATYRFCMEATGSYYLALATFLAEGSQWVSVVNPYRTHHAAKAQGAGNKTDAAESAVLADYCRQQNPPLWRRAAPEVRTLVGLLRRLQTLKDTLNQEQNRLGDPGVSPEVVVSLNKSIAFLKEQIADLKSQIETHIKAHPNLKADRELLISIPGIGALTAAWLMAELPDVNVLLSAASAAAYAGLAPCEYTSGTSVKHQTHLSKRGNAILRQALFMPALSAMRCNAAVQAICERLLAKGRPRMVAVGAAMRKLLMIAYGVLKHRKPFVYPVVEV
jgi:transposase